MAHAKNTITAEYYASRAYAGYAMMEEDGIREHLNLLKLRSINQRYLLSELPIISFLILDSFAVSRG